MSLNIMNPSNPHQNKVHTQITDESLSPLKRYQSVILGSSNLRFFVRFEFAQFLCKGFPGAVGLWLRKHIYPGLLQQVSSGVVFGQNLTLRHPKKIKLGRNVVIDDYCVLDARGDSNEGIEIGDDVILARNINLGCKNGNIKIGDNVGIGANSTIHAIGSSHVTVGDNVVIGSYTYLVGGSHYHADRTDIPISQQGLDLRGGIRIEDNVWIGTRATVLDGVTVGRDAVIGTGAVVTKDVPDFAIVTGVPAKVVRIRKS